MDRGCSYFTQASLKSLDFLEFVVKYSGLYASCTVYENDNQRPLSAAGDLSKVSVCLAHSHYNRVSLAAKAFRTER